MIVVLIFHHLCVAFLLIFLKLKNIKYFLSNDYANQV